MNTYLLFVDTSKMYIYDVYDRLLSIVVEDILYTEVLQNDIIKNAIVIQTNLQENDIIKEVSEILFLIGYNYKFEILKPIV